MPSKHVAALAAIALAVTLVAVLATFSRPAAAQLAPRDQRDADVTYLPEREEFLLVWSEDRGAGNRIYAKRVRANGLPVGGAGGGTWQAVNRRTTEGYPAPEGDQRWPAVVGGMLIYSERAPGETSYDLYGQRLFDNGRPNGTPMQVHGGPGDQAYGDVLVVDRGRAGNEYLIVWSEDTRDAGDVMGLRVDFALRRSRGPAFAIARGPGTAEDPVVSRDLLDDDSFLVLYTDDRSGNRDIYGVRLTGSGLPRGGPIGGPFPVVESPDADYAPAVVNSLDRPRAARGPTPTPTPRGGRRITERPTSLLVWTVETLADGPNVMGQRLAANGLPKGRPFVLAGGAGVQAWPATALRTAEDDPRRRGPVEQRDEWLTIWLDDGLGSTDVLGALVRTNGLRRPMVRVLAAD